MSKVNINKPAPDFTLQDYHGNLVSLSHYMQKQKNSLTDSSERGEGYKNHDQPMVMTKAYSHRWQPKCSIVPKLPQSTCAGANGALMTARMVLRS